MERLPRHLLIDVLLSLASSSNFVLYVPTVYDYPRYFDKLFAIWHEIQQLPDSHLDIIVDFHYCEFLGHNGVAFLGGLVRLIESRGGRVTFDWESLSRRIYMNLAQNGFLCDFGCNLNPWDGNSIPYRCDIQHDPNAIADYLRYKWLGKGWVNISPALQEEITGQASEIYLNAFEHSSSDIGVFSCGQHYHNVGFLQLTVVDFGIGIASSVRSLPENSAMLATEALAWAFLPGTTTKQDGICGGSGLNLLQEFITENHGKLMIFSNDGCVTIDDNGMRYENKCTNFSGTVVNIAFRCDESYYCLASEVPNPEKPWF
jgi:hypothetical protein